VNHDEPADRGLQGAPVADRQELDGGLRIELLRQAVLKQPRSEGLLFQLSDALADVGRDRESAEAFRQAYVMKPRVLPKLDRRPEVALDVRARKLRDRASTLIAHGAIFSPVIAALAQADALLGREAEARSLVDYDRFFRYYSMPVPNGMSTADFNRELAAEARSHLQFYDAPSDRAIRKAWRNNTLLSPKFPVAWSLASALRDEVSSYVRKLPSDPNHPFLASRPAEFVIEGWSVVSSNDSHHEMHIHDKAWLSGVYYVVRPPVSMMEGSQRGWLRVGPPDGVPESAGWDSRSIEPEPGKLVLMPGYFYHGTRPMGVEEERICIAFDVVPKELASDGS
jgi:hypothetical protein